MIWKVYYQSTQTWRFAEHHSKLNEILTKNYYLLTVVCFTVHLDRAVRISCVPEKMGVNQKYLNKNNILINKVSNKRKWSSPRVLNQK